MQNCIVEVEYPLRVRFILGSFLALVVENIRISLCIFTSRFCLEYAHLEIYFVEEVFLHRPSRFGRV